MLLEALISVLLMSIIGAGTAYVASRIVVGAKNARVDGVAVSQMRMLLQHYGPELCPKASDNALAKVVLPDSSEHMLEVKCPGASTVKVGGLVVSQPSTVVLCTRPDDVMFNGRLRVGDDVATPC